MLSGNRFAEVSSERSYATAAREIITDERDALKRIVRSAIVQNERIPFSGSNVRLLVHEVKPADTTHQSLERPL
jgi:hypothetical protein